MLLFLFLIVPFVLAVPFTVESIVDGLPTGSSDRYPMIVSFSQNDVHFCGGTLIDEFTIVTAAHCRRTLSVGIIATAHRFDFLKTNEEERAVVFQVVSVVDHPLYRKGFGSDVAYDVSIWKVKHQSGDLNSLRLNTVRLDDGTKSKAGQLLQTAGWGALAFGGATSNELLEITIPVTTLEYCQAAYPLLDVPSTICAGFPEGGKDACKDDSGGPLFAFEKDIFTLVGIVSFGDGCAKPGFPGVYARITSVADFIKSNMGP